VVPSSSIPVHRCILNQVYSLGCPLTVVRRGRRRSPSSSVVLVGWIKLYPQTQTQKSARAKRKKKDIQNVSYVLADELDSFEESENMKRWIDNTIGWKEVKGKEQDYEILKKQYGKFTEEDLDRTIDRDLSYFLLNVLFELDTLVSYS
jgi:hypothetical protein